MTVDSKVYQAARLVVPFWLHDKATHLEIDAAAQMLAEVMQEFLEETYGDV